MSQFPANLPNIKIDRNRTIVCIDANNDVMHSTDNGTTWQKLMNEYQQKCNWALEYAKNSVDIGLMTKAIPPTREGEWEDLYLSGLYRNGLMLTQNIAYTMMGDTRYPGGVPVYAPRPKNDEDANLWPPATWIIYRD